MTRNARNSLYVALLIAATTKAYGHHATAPHFYADQEVVLNDAVITEFKFVNPHTYVYLEVTDGLGMTADWRCEMTSVTRLRRRGWTAETLLPGEVISVTGTPARREENVCHVEHITRADGTQLSLSREPGAEGEPASDAAIGGPAPSRPAYLANGQPNLRGPWIIPQRNNRGTSVPEPTAEGARAAEDYVFEFDNPALSCHPASIIFAWDFAAEVADIYQADDRITLQYGYMDLVRTIHLNQSEHPEQISPSVAGHSIGWWEGNALVVDTVGFEPGVLWPPENLMHSEALHVMERFEIGSDGNSLIRTYTAEDPRFLQVAFAGRNVSMPSPEPYVPYDCTELSGKNNQRPAE